MSSSYSKKDSFKSALKGRFIKEYDYSTFENIKRIASGAFGTVYCAKSTSLEKHVALKCLHENDELFYEKFVRELTNIMAVNNHDNIINFYGISKDPSTETYFLVLQYAKDGDLRTYLRNNFKSLNWKVKINMAKDITSGLRCIHQENIVHKDLHSKNILVHEGRLLITDLGLSQSLDSNSNSTGGGMIAYTDPEYLRNHREYKRNKTSDIYSLGVLFWELSSGRPPFNNIPNLEIYKKVASSEREKPINGSPKDYINIYSKAWKNDPHQRPTIENIFDSLKNIKLDNIYNDSNDNQEDYIINKPQASINVLGSRDSISITSCTTSNLGEVIVMKNFQESSTSLSTSLSASLSASLSTTLNSNDYDNVTNGNQIIKYNYSDFKNLKNIGKGFGMIYRATLINGKKTVALKSIVIANTNAQLFVNELKKYSRVGSHKNIIRFYGISQKDLKSNEYILVLEYANGGTLRDHLKSNFESLEWINKLNLAHQIVKAIKHLHSNDIIHGDLHSKNILLHDNTIKISDFGITRLSTESSIDSKNSLGSIEYSDPMILKRMGKYRKTKASDIYSIGILLWEISCGKIPYESKFPDKINLIFYVSQGNREDPIIGTPQDYINIYQDCWNQDPNHRPNIGKVVQDLEYVDLANIFVESIDWLPNKPVNSFVSPARSILTPKLTSRVNETFSSTINKEHVSELSSWVDRKSTIYSSANNPYEFQLILRGSRDGFHPKTFWNMCHGHAGTIVVVKIAGTDEIVGGYNPLAWDNSKRGSKMKTNDSFIFSLKNRNNENSILSRVIDSSNRALYYHNDQNTHGPWFGNCEFMMKSDVSDFTQDKQCRCRVGSFNRQKSRYFFYEKSITTSSKNFSIVDYEVFKIIKKKIPKRTIR
ncbi:hypothetical protein Glove_87g16 [Diversispora epigaea]|uniref:Non-specific protein-tyrosine kinase n=1 Tax=Diversispora epigaea TaxID=1348612 RepID=A0A397JAR8_9GLOM|nr:hypothetical protein Glove_87g16 [Diversispora epigaea]